MTYHIQNAFAGMFLAIGLLLFDWVCVVYVEGHGEQRHYSVSQDKCITHERRARGLGHRAQCMEVVSYE